jgi:UPF0755 protein
VSDLSFVQRRRGTRALRVLIAGVVFLAVAAAAAWWMIRPVSGDPHAAPAVVVIPPGTTAWGVGRRLADAGVVRSAGAVVLVSRVLRLADRLQQGEYAVRPSLSTMDIVRMISRGESIQHRVVVPEGYTVAQIADVLAASGIADRDRVLALGLRGGRTLNRATLEDLPIDSLEGYLFPDTYQFPRGLPEAAVLGRFLDHFDAKVGSEVRAAARARGLTLHQLLTVASIIEREARVPEERSIIAGVIYNRLARGMRLEIDATVLYALGAHKTVVTLKDLEVDSPYNTYRHAGLPPGPIANPGLAAIAAAATPADVPYFYYVLRPDGRHHFSRTPDEHLDAVRRYQR